MALLVDTMCSRAAILQLRKANDAATKAFTAILDIEPLPDLDLCPATGLTEPDNAVTPPTCTCAGNIQVIRGIDGRDGAPGKEGTDGAPGKKGTDGAPGKDGKDGAPGKDGKDGEDVVVRPQMPG